jgi:hypothetical protein
LHKFHWAPSFYADLSINEKAFVIAAIDIKLKNDKRKADEIKHKTKK